jgi:hypothetical protein
MKKTTSNLAPFLLTVGLAASPLMANDDLPGEVIDYVEPTKTSNTRVTTKIANEFDPALMDNLVEGSHSEDIVTGLREGTAFDYQYTNADGQLVTQTIDPAYGLGYGEVRHALTLSEQNGGDLQAVLDMREAGLGWGQIAQQQGSSLGAAKKLPLTSTVVSGSGSSSQTSGITSGSGESTSVQTGHAKSKHYVSASRGKGITDGGGFENASLNSSHHKVSSGSNNGNGGGAKASHAITSSSGSGIVHGGGNAYGHSAGKSNGKAHGKGKH